MKYSLSRTTLITCTYIVVDLIISTLIVIKTDQSIDHDAIGRPTNNNSSLINASQNFISTNLASFFTLDMQSPTKWITSHRYNFLACQLDFLAISTLRVVILGSAILCFWCASPENRVHANLKSSTSLFVCIFLSLFSYAPIKLLALAELVDDFSTVPWFWVVLLMNAVFCISSAFVWMYVLARCQVTRQQSKTDLTKPQSAKPQMAEEAEPLVDGLKSRRKGRESQQNNINKSIKSTAPRATSPKILINKLTGLGTNANLPQRLRHEDEPPTLEVTLGTAKDNSEADSEVEHLDLKQSVSLMFRLLKYCRNEWLWYLSGFVFLFAHSGGELLS